MAIDRLYLRCTRCNASVAIAKWSPSAGAGHDMPDAMLGKLVNDFLLKHSQAEHIPADQPVNLDAGSGFAIDSEETLPS